MIDHCQMITRYLLRLGSVSQTLGQDSRSLVSSVFRERDLGEAAKAAFSRGAQPKQFEAATRPGPWAGF